MDFVGQILTAVILVAAGVLLMWSAAATASGRLGRNGLIGIRVASTMASDEAWLIAHQRSKVHITAAGAVTVVAGLLILLPMSEWLFTTVLLGTCAIIIVLVVWGMIAGTRAVKEYEASQTQP